MTVQVMIDKCENRHRRCNALSLFALRQAIAIADDYLGAGRVVTVPPLDVTARKIIFAFLNMFRKIFFFFPIFVLGHVRPAGGGGGVCVSCCGVQRSNKRVKLNVHSN